MPRLDLAPPRAPLAYARPAQLVAQLRATRPWKYSERYGAIEGRVLDNAERALRIVLANSGLPAGAASVLRRTTGRVFTKVASSLITTPGGDMPYVVAEPPAARGVYDEWEECLAALEGVPGARRLMKVTSREEGEGILEGRGIRLDPGLYAFTDGSGSGGIGVVIVRMGADPDGEPEVLAEVASSVDDAFRENPVPGLQSANEIRTALARLKNILAEMGALYAAVHQAPAGEELTVVHDYAGVGAFMRERRPWRPRGALTPLVAAIQGLATQKGLTLTFRHQASHRSDWAGRNDYVKFNRLADELAARY